MQLSAMVVLVGGGGSDLSCIPVFTPDPGPSYSCTLHLVFHNQLHHAALSQPIGAVWRVNAQGDVIGGHTRAPFVLNHLFQWHTLMCCVTRVPKKPGKSTNHQGKSICKINLEQRCVFWKHNLMLVYTPYNRGLQPFLAQGPLG